MCVCAAFLNVQAGRMFSIPPPPHPPHPPIDKRFPDNAKLDLIFTPVNSDKDQDDGGSLHSSPQ